MRNHPWPERQTSRLRLPAAAALLSLFALLAACATLDEARPAPATPATAAGSDPVTLSFVFVGCNRVGWGEKDGHPLPPSTANTPQLLQTFEDVKALGQERGHAPDYLFLVGDIVRNETSGETLQQQLDLWQGLWDSGALAASSTQLVPLTGNHETLKSVEYADNEFYEVPDASSNGAWLTWLNKNQHPPQPGNGPAPGDDASDLLRGDNGQLTYSFDAQTTDGKSIHFVVMDTDTDSTYSTEDSSCYQPPQKQVTYEGHPVEGTMSQSVPGWIPLDWVEKDLRGAKDSDLVFAFGHKPLFFPATATADTASTGRDSIFNCGEKVLAKELLASFQEMDNFVAYLTSHKHLWNEAQISGPDGSVWQIVAGNGGSELEQGAEPFFGFTLVEIHASGMVTATPYTRPVPGDYYYSSTGVGPATSGDPVLLRKAGS